MKINKKIIIFTIIFLIALVGIIGYTQFTKKGTNIESGESNPIATIEFEGIGTMTFELYPDQAPQTVYNFISLANDGFYDGLKMHRILPNFVAQGGDPDGIGTGGPGYSIKGEFTSNGVDNTLLHEKGSLAMARSALPDSAGSQFYICLDDLPSLDGEYAVFGTMITGEDVLEELQKIAENSDPNTGIPTKEVIIKSITVDTKGETYPEPKKLK